MTSYALPVAVPHGRDAPWPGHSHTLSHSPPRGPLGHARSYKTEAPNGSPNGHGHSHVYGHTHSHSHAHEHHEAQNHSHYRANSNHPIHHRPHIPPPLSSSNGWTTAATAGGKPLITPTHATFEKAYEAPPQSTKPYDHGAASRSTFTNLLLPYTAKFPLLHTVMTEKDSRRIFYFMV